MSKKGGYLVAWKHAYRSKEDGGLGIINLWNHNYALLLKFLLKFYHRLDLPWVHLTWEKLYSNGKPPHERKNVGFFWWRDIMSLATSFFLITKCKANRQIFVAFWSDHWDLGVVKVKFPQLHSFPRKKRCSVSQFLTWD
jgi:hypothetical protein